MFPLVVIKIGYSDHHFEFQMESPRPNWVFLQIFFFGRPSEEQSLDFWNGEGNTSHASTESPMSTHFEEIIERAFGNAKGTHVKKLQVGTSSPLALSFLLSNA